MSSLGGFIRSLREQRGISFRALAAQSGVSHTSIRNWETGQFLPRMHELALVLDALGSSPEQKRQAVELTQRPRAVARIRRSEEADFGDTLITQGDMLRALRLRRNRTQEDVATGVGVAIRTVSRWERGECQPDISQIHAVCRALNATPEEVGLLTVAILPPDGARCLGMTLQELKTEVDDAGYGPFSPERTTLTELVYISLAARLQPLAWQDATARRLLARTYTSLANHYYLQGRLGSVFAFAARALELMRPVPSASGEAVIAAIRCAAVSPTPVRGISLLEEWLPRLPKHTWQAWCLSEMAKLAAKAGYGEEADTLSLRSLARAATLEPTELILRRVDRAELLAECGRADESPGLLPAVAPDTDPAIPPAWAKLSLARQDYGRADQMIRTTHQILDRRANDWAHMVPFIRAKINAVANSMPK